MYPRQARRLIQDPVKGIFVPLIVSVPFIHVPHLALTTLPFKVLSFATIIIGTINYTIPTGHTSPEFIYILFW